MGQNRRHLGGINHDVDRALQNLARRSHPISLNADELDKEHTTVTTPETPIEVQAWFRFPESSLQVRGRAIAWTQKAVLVEWEPHDGGTHQVWVWASAVDRLGR